MCTFPQQSETRQQHPQGLRLIPESHLLDDVRPASHDLDGGNRCRQALGQLVNRTEISMLVKELSRIGVCDPRHFPKGRDPGP